MLHYVEYCHNFSKSYYSLVFNTQSEIEMSLFTVLLSFDVYVLTLAWIQTKAKKFQI